ncbi:MAG: hypothetical protein II859_02955 [Bacteroidales bacterium]|nr:hypothetical protein [Bacteroidales bacterium]
MNPLRGFDNRTGVRSPTDMHPLTGMGAEEIPLAHCVRGGMVSAAG